MADRVFFNAYLSGFWLGKKGGKKIEKRAGVHKYRWTPAEIKKDKRVCPKENKRVLQRQQVVFHYNNFRLKANKIKGFESCFYMKATLLPFSANKMSTKTLCFLVDYLMYQN